jgi:hypothetical protein
LFTYVCFFVPKAEFDGTFEVLMGKAQDIMNVVKGLLKDAQQGNWGDLQVQITHAIEELQRVCSLRAISRAYVPLVAISTRTFLLLAGARCQANVIGFAAA